MTNQRNDRQLLEDIQELKQHLSTTIGLLISECNKLYGNAQNEHSQIKILVQKCKQEISQDIERIYQATNVLQTLGGVVAFRDVLHQLQSAREFLSSYESNQQSLQNSLDKYLSLPIEAEIKQLNEQLQRCEHSRIELSEASKNVEELHILCRELLQAQQFLNARGIEGFPGFYAYLETASQSIEQNLVNFSYLLETLRTEASHAQTLQEQLQNSQDAIHQILDLPQRMEDQLATLSDRIQTFQSSINERQHQFEQFAQSEQQITRGLQAYTELNDSRYAQIEQQLVGIEAQNQEYTVLFSQSEAQINILRNRYTASIELFEQYRHDQGRRNDHTITDINSQITEIKSFNADIQHRLNDVQNRFDEYFIRHDLCLNQVNVQAESLKSHQRDQETRITNLTNHIDEFIQLPTFIDSEISTINQQFHESINNLSTRVGETERVMLLNQKLYRKFRWQAAVGVLIMTIGGVIVSTILSRYVDLCWLFPNSNVTVCRQSEQSPSSKSQN